MRRLQKEAVLTLRDVFVIRALSQWCRHYPQQPYHPTASELHSFSAIHHGFSTQTRDRSEGLKRSVASSVSPFSVAAHADKLIGERYTGVQKRAKPPLSSKKPQARAVRSRSNVDAQLLKRSTRSSKKEPQAQALRSQSTLAAQPIPPEPVQQSPATASVRPRRRPELEEEEYPSKR